MQDLQSLKHEIISALDLLPADSLKLLAKFVAFLRSNGTQIELDQLKLAQELEIPTPPVRITSPRLVHREQVADFK